MRARIQWEPRDVWVGLYWTKATFSTHLYVCLIPCFPLHVWFMHGPKPPFPGDMEGYQP